jgi:dihydrofolate reductase
MRKLVLKMSISVDGFVGGPNGESDWIHRTMDKSALEWVGKILEQAGVHVVGSKTFHDMAAYFPTSSDPLAIPMNKIPKVVFSKKGIIKPGSPELTTQALKDKRKADTEKGIKETTISKNSETWTNATIASDLVKDITKLKEQDGNFILAHGGANFAQNLVKYNLIDEYCLVIHPAVLGNGLPLFKLAPDPF